LAELGPVAGSFGLAFVLAYAATPVAIRVAKATAFYDRPGGYKEHRKPTPYLGGAAVLAGFVPAALIFGGSLSVTGPIIACALLLFAVGTRDDRVNLAPGTRLVAAATAAAALYAVDLGWSILGSGAANLALTIVFVVGVVNAYNLMDNLDGAASSVGVVSATGLGALALIEGADELAALAFGLAGAYAGFLPRNLSRPARIFLGDGGSMPLGLVVAAVIMPMPGSAEIGWGMVLVSVVLVGLPALDTFLVAVSRRRRGASLFSGGTDHLTHRLLGRLGSARRVCLVLAAAQAALVGLGLVLFQLDREAALAGAGVLIVLAIGAVAAFETSSRSLALRRASACDPLSR